MWSLRDTVSREVFFILSCKYNSIPVTWSSMWPYWVITAVGFALKCVLVWRIFSARLWLVSAVSVVVFLRSCVSVLIERAGSDFLWYTEAYTCSLLTHEAQTNKNNVDGPSVFCIFSKGIGGWLDLINLVSSPVSRATAVVAWGGRNEEFEYLQSGYANTPKLLSMVFNVGYILSYARALEDMLHQVCRSSILSSLLSYYKITRERKCFILKSWSRETAVFKSKYRSVFTGGSTSY